MPSTLKAREQCHTNHGPQIPRVDALISRHYWLHKNQTVGLDNAVSEVLRRNLSEVNWDYAMIERINPRDLATTLVPFTSRDVLCQRA